MADVSIIHTAHLPVETLAEARSMTFAAFESTFTDADWDHGLGGLHAIARDDGGITGHASLVQRHLMYEGRSLRAGYVEAVAVHPDHRREGLGDDLLTALEGAIVFAYDLGVLKTTEVGMPFYLSRGWEPWRGELHAFTPEGIEAHPHVEGAVLVFGVRAGIDTGAELTCDFRSGDVW